MPGNSRDRLLRKAQRSQRTTTNLAMICRILARKIVCERKCRRGMERNFNRNDALGCRLRYNTVPHNYYELRVIRTHTRTRTYVAHESRVLARNAIEACNRASCIFFSPESASSTRFTRAAKARGKNVYVSEHRRDVHSARVHE